MKSTWLIALAAISLVLAIPKNTNDSGPSSGAVSAPAVPALVLPAPLVPLNLPKSNPPTPKQLTNAGFQAAPDAETGKSFGKWLVLKSLGQGAFGTVLLAFNGKDFAAIKFINRSEKLVSEVTVHWKIRNVPGVVELYGYILDDKHPNAQDNRYGMIMEAANGGDLTHYIHTFPAGIPVPEAKPLFKQLVITMSKIHAMGIALRDIKPDNILVFKNKNKVTLKHSDFGTCIDAATKTRGPVGTTQYMPTGDWDVKAPNYIDLIKTDIYALGVTLLELITGKSILTLRQVREAVGNKSIYQPIDLKHPSLAILWRMDTDLKTLLEGMLNEIVAERWTDQQVLDSKWLKTSN